MSEYKNAETGVTQSETESSRRKFLKQAGKFAVYTPPAIMLLSKPSFASMCKSYTGDHKREAFKKDFHFSHVEHDGYKVVQNRFSFKGRDRH